MDDARRRSGRFTVVICTRDRPGFLAQALDGLAGQSCQEFAVLVVDQGGAGPVVRGAGMPRVSLLTDRGRGLSRARNLAWRAVETEWVVFLDDDCVPSPTWAEELHRTIESIRDADFIGAAVVPGSTGDGLEGVHVAVSEPRRPGLRSGRWVRPWDIGLGACMAVRRSAIERLGGWDERLGAGSGAFPASEDMDFNYRLLRGGSAAYVSKTIQVEHRQWRPPEDLPRHLGGYMAAWAGFSMKHLRKGDVAGGLWLWAWGPVDIARTLVGAVRRRSRLGLRVTAAKVTGLLTGTGRGLTHGW
ncbi:MAG: glycosyltransferase family 2 protein [Acidimicrobiia bacterium]